MKRKIKQQFQQIEQSVLTLTHWTQKTGTTYDVGNQSTGLGQAKNEKRTK